MYATRKARAPAPAETERRPLRLGIALCYLATILFSLFYKNILEACPEQAEGILPMDQIQHPRIFNSDTSTQLIGIAHDPDANLIYYCSHAGYGVSLKAVFSSLASNTKKNIGCS